jgi:hypothetical protein
MDPMKNIAISVVSIAALGGFLGAVAPAQAAPAGIGDQASGILGSPVSQLPVEDPVIEKAIQWLKANQQQSQSRYVDARSTAEINRHYDCDHFMIMGGSETLPM